MLGWLAWRGASNAGSQQQGRCFGGWVDVQGCTAGRVMWHCVEVLSAGEANSPHTALHYRRRPLH